MKLMMHFISSCAWENDSLYSGTKQGALFQASLVFCRLFTFKDKQMSKENAFLKRVECIGHFISSFLRSTFTARNV